MRLRIRRFNFPVFLFLLLFHSRLRPQSSCVIIFFFFLSFCCCCCCYCGLVLQNKSLCEKRKSNSLRFFDGALRRRWRRSSCFLEVMTLKLLHWSKRVQRFVTPGRSKKRKTGWSSKVCDRLKAAPPQLSSAQLSQLQQHYTPTISCWYFSLYSGKVEVKLLKNFHYDWALTSCFLFILIPLGDINEIKS